ncbi:dihydroxyacetone kinase subunit DhaK [Streptomyces sp. CA2R106]|uniref:dihydroxyacetone kinase subunit DhaK n=1 Tax=Streptomyces sp. CA2R106 TaxID=3120153 RepID=UPI00300877F0
MPYFLPETETDPVLTACRGLVLAHPDRLALSEKPLYLTATAPDPARRVALVSGGGSGHDPLHTGLLGRGGLDAAAPGGVFASPHNGQIFAASLATHHGGGVLHIVKNYTGDKINFGIAAERLHARGVEVATVEIADDIASADAGAGRRGTAATVVVEKILGAAADTGMGLYELADLGRAVADASRSLAVCARPHTNPASLRPAAMLPPDMLDYGVGIHGERGARSIARPRVQDLIRRMLSDLTADTPTSPDGVILVVNGLGGTSHLELQAVAAIAAEQLHERGERVAAVLTGTHTAALDMAGISLTLTALAPGWLDWWQAPTDTPLTAWPGAAAPPQPAAPAASPRTPLPRRLPGSRAALDRYAEIISHVRDALGDLDQAAGDGDFGDNLTGGLRGALARVDATGEDGLTAAAHVFLDEVGGTSGPLFGLLFQHLGAVTAGCPDGQRPALSALAKALADGTTAIQRVGGARMGDRTLVDALAPAAQLLSVKREDDPAAITTAALAAIHGARGTADMLGGRGRSSYVGKRALGTPDPGAIGAALLLIALADTYEPEMATRLPLPGYVVQPATRP